MAWCGDSTSGKIADPMPWTDELLMIRKMVEPLAGLKFNSVLLNYYRDGNDSVAWHSDKENILGKRPVIASVSFGQVRSFDVRNKLDHKEHYSVKLEHGSFLHMKGGLQEGWEHRIAKSAKPMRPRINLTFRVVTP
jgi:alkylated DNA repair dioxygenase AlkB